MKKKISKKFLFERWRNNIGIISFILSIRMNMIIQPIWWGWFVIGFLVSIAYLWYDLKHIYPKENLSSSELNPAWNMQMDLLRKILDKVSKGEQPCRVKK
jgi:hypothetical protein